MSEIENNLEKIFQNNKEYYSIIFESASPSTTTKLVVKEREGVERYFSLMKDTGFVTWYKINEEHPNGDWSIAFTLKNYGNSKYIAKIQSLRYCQI